MADTNVAKTGKKISEKTKTTVAIVSAVLGLASAIGTGLVSLLGAIDGGDKQK